MCLCVNTCTITKTYTNPFPAPKALLSVEENNDRTSIKAHEVISFCSKCELSTYIPIFKCLLKYQREAEIIEFVKIGKINQERHSN